MPVSSEWFIITPKVFSLGVTPWILPPVPKKYEDGLSNFDPSAERNWSRAPIPNLSFPAFLLTYHIVTGGEFGF